MTSSQEQMLFQKLINMTEMLNDMRQKIEEQELFQPAEVDISEVIARSCVSRSTILDYLYKNFKQGEHFTQTVKNGKIKVQRDVALQIWRRYGKH